MKLISQGVIGLSVVLSGGVFYLLKQEQKQKMPRPAMMKMCYFLTVYCILSVLIVGFLTLPTYNENKKLNENIVLVNTEQVKVSQAIDSESRFVDSLLAINRLMQDSLTSLFLKQRGSNSTWALSEIANKIPSASIIIPSMKNDSSFNVENGKSIEHLKGQLVLADQLKTKLKVGTITAAEKIALVKISGEVNYKIVTLKMQQKQSHIKVLRTKIQNIFKPEK